MQRHLRTEGSSNKTHSRLARQDVLRCCAFELSSSGDDAQDKNALQRMINTGSRQTRARHARQQFFEKLRNSSL